MLLILQIQMTKKSQMDHIWQQIFVIFVRCKPRTFYSTFDKATPSFK